MTISKARKLLELSEDEYSDEQVEEIIDETMMLAKFFMDRFIKGDISPEEALNKLEKSEKTKLPIKLFTKIGYNSGGNKSKFKQSGINHDS